MRMNCGENGKISKSKNNVVGGKFRHVKVKSVELGNGYGVEKLYSKTIKIRHKEYFQIFRIEDSWFISRTIERSGFGWKESDFSILCSNPELKCGEYAFSSYDAAEVVASVWLRSGTEHTVDWLNDFDIEKQLEEIVKIRRDKPKKKEFFVHKCMRLVGFDL